MSSTKIHSYSQPTKEAQLRGLKQRVASSRSQVGQRNISGPPVDMVEDVEDRSREYHYGAARSTEHSRNSYESPSRQSDAHDQYQHHHHHRSSSSTLEQRAVQLQPQPPPHARMEESSPHNARRMTDHSGGSLHSQAQSPPTHSHNYVTSATHSTASELSLPDVRRLTHTQSEGIAPASNGQPRPTRAKPAARDLPVSRVLTFQEVHCSRLEIGLENLGNTCFMNSTLQCLLHIEPLVSYFLLGKMEADINPASPKRGMIAASFHHLIQDVYNGKSGSAIAPVNFQRVVSLYAPYLMDFQQQDSQEFLRFLLDGMSEDLCRRKPANSSNNNAIITINNSNAGNSSSSSNHSNGESGRAITRTPTGKSGAILPSLPQISTTSSNGDSPRTPATRIPPTSSTTTSPPSMSATLPGGAGTDIPPGSTGRLNSIQRLRLETRAMRGQDTTAELGNNHTSRTSNQEDDAEDQGADVTTLASATFPGMSKMRLMQDVHQARITTDSDENAANSRVNGNLGAAEGEIVPPMLSTDEDPPSPRAEGVHTQTRQFYSGSFSSQLRDVVTGRTLRLRRNKTSSDGQEIVGKVAPAVSSIDDGSGDSSKQHHHNDLATLSIGGTQSIADSSVEMDAALAWERYLKLNESIITDIFGGLLQSTIQCQSCHHKSHSFDPFLDISVPISRDADNAGSARGLFGSLRQAALSSEANRSSLEKCLAKFTAEEVLDGDNLYHCEKCKKKRKSVKQLMIYRYPKVLVIHIKRFRFNSTSREKLSTDVHFPLTGLDLSPFVRKITGVAPPGEEEADPRLAPGTVQKVDPTAKTSADPAVAAPVSSGQLWRQCHNLRGIPPVYDLVGVSNHHGSLNGGHYIAHVDTNNGYVVNHGQRWMCFNDSRVSNANATSIAGPTAYVLFYRLREDSSTSPAASTALSGVITVAGASTASAATAMETKPQ